MNHNLFIYYNMVTAYEDAVIKAIQSLGNVTRLGNGFWYINASVNASEALKRVASRMTNKDSAIIIDSTNNQTLWFNLDEAQAQRIRQNWDMPLGQSPKTADGNEQESPIH